MRIDGLRIRVVGDGEFARAAAEALDAQGATILDHAAPAGTMAGASLDAVVFAPWDRSRIVPRPLAELTDDEFDEAWQQTMDDAIAACVEARESFAGGPGNIVLTFPTTGFVGGAFHAHWAAAAEGVHILARSVARQWGAEGITVNALAIDAAILLANPVSAGPVSIAAPAVPGARPDAVLAFLCSAEARDLAGQTLTVDGGLWM
jgi:NAD(P)-dependent dehydrogenase (short-subunit alcohol dehydrogenase family)